jgi:hypothetical protein
VRFNPNLYINGKVCLSLLGTWSGPSWNPKTSTLLQARPFCTPPLWAHLSAPCLSAPCLSSHRLYAHRLLPRASAHPACAARRERARAWCSVHGERGRCLQVLVSLQAMVFCKHPYFNEPGHERHMATARGDEASAAYNASILYNTIRQALPLCSASDSEQGWKTLYHC